MTNYFEIKIFVILFFAFNYHCLQGQNIVPNPDFHNYGICPDNYGQFNCDVWANPSVGSSDYYNICSADIVGIPNNLNGFQESETGEAYIGMALYSNTNVDWREYAQVELTEPLIVGGCYEMSISYNRVDLSSSCNNLGMLLTNGIPDVLIGQNPQLEVTNVMDDNINWNTETKQYIALGNETHLTIGNFRTNPQTTFVEDPVNTFYAYYFVDFVSIEYIGSQSDQVIVDIGEDLIICQNDFPITLESNNPNAINIWSTGGTTSSINVSEPGKYYLTIYENCEFGIDSLEIFVIEEPTLELDDQVFCEGESFTVNLDPSLGDYEWNDGSNSTNYSISDPGIYTVQLTHECGIIEESIEIETIKFIDISEIEDFYLCSSDLPLIVELFDYDDGVNQFNWSTGSDESVVFLWESGSVSVEIFNDCFLDDISFDVFIDDDLPDEIPFIDTLICPGESVFINTGLIDIDLIWEDGSNESSYLVNEPGTYNLTATNTCGEKVYTFEIKESSELVFDLGTDLSICPGDSVLLVSPLGEDLLWNGMILSEEIWIKEEGFVIAEYNGTCNFATDTIEILFNGQIPEIELPDSLFLCPGDSILVSAGNTSSGVDYMWNTGSVLNEIYISESGVYNVVGTNNCGSGMDSVVITLGESLPNIVLESVYTICPGDTLELIIESWNAEVNWSIGSQDSIVKLTEDGIYGVSIGNICKTIEIGFAIQFEETLSAFDLGVDKSICLGESVEIQGPDLDGTYLWNTAEISTSIEVSTPGTYVLEIKGICNTVLDSLTVIDLGDVPTIELGQDIEICEGDSVELLVVGNGIDEIIWNTGDTTENIEVFNEGIYIVEVMNLCGISSDSIFLTYNTEAPQIELGMNMHICEGDSILLDVGPQSGIITWNTGDLGESIYVSEEGWYGASLSSSCGESYDSVFISKLAGPPDFDLGVDTTICNGTSIEINLPELFFFDVEWQDGSVLPFQTLEEEATYWMSASNMCGEIIDSITIDFYPTIYPFSFDPVEDLCHGDTVVLDGYQDNVESFIWQDNSTESSFVVTESGLYSLIVEGICESFDSEINIEYIELAILESIIDTSYLFCEGEVLSLDLETNGIDEILWEDGSTEFERTFVEAGNYIFQLFNFCQDITYSFDLAFEDCIADQVYVPNIFTPNDDGINDVFSIEIPSDWIDPSVKVAIYNRWGERMFYSEEKDIEWDGKFQGKTLNPGVYVYLINIEVELEEKVREIVFQGDITIVK